MALRLEHLMNQMKSSGSPLKPSNVSSYTSGQKSDDDVVIVSGIRTAIGKARKGSFANTTALQMLTPCLKHVAKDIDPSLVGDIVVGSVLGESGMRASECRQAAFIAGFPRETCVRTVNRQCSSGLQAIADVASAIKAGFYDIGIAAGVESMTSNAMARTVPKILDEVKQNGDALNCFMPMGITSENVAAKYGVSREEQDKFSLLSQQRAMAAREKFREEIIPVHTTVKDRKTGKKQYIVVTDDDGIRDTTLAGLQKLRPAFKKNGTTTAGSSSQVSDGASAVLMMKRSTARLLQLPIMGRFVHFAVAGVDPAVMGIGPAFAIPKVLKGAGLTTDDIDVFEINEAFASQALYCVRELKLDMDKVNPNGGAIALGHPLGCTGCRMTVTLLNEMRRRGAKRGIVSMCIGTGMGAAGIFELD